jgi:hypothetical protein
MKWKKEKLLGSIWLIPVNGNYWEEEADREKVKEYFEEIFPYLFQDGITEKDYLDFRIEMIKVNTYKEFMIRTIEKEVQNGNFCCVGDNRCCCGHSLEDRGYQQNQKEIFKKQNCFLDSLNNKKDSYQREEK